MSPATLEGPTLRASTTPTRLPDGSFRSRLDDHWNSLNGRPLGGYTMAAVLRALVEDMPDVEPLSATALFVRPASVGALTVHTEVVRTGRTLAIGAALARQQDREVLRLTATFGSPQRPDGPTARHATPPQLPDPDDCVDPLAGAIVSGATVADRVQYRFPEAPGWRHGRPTGTAVQEFWMRLARPEPVDASSLAFLVDAAAPGVLELGAAGSSTVELAVQFRGRPRTQWLACRCSTRFLVDGLHEEDFEIWDADGTLMAISRQFALAR